MQRGRLSPLGMTVLAADGLLLRGTLAYPSRGDAPYPLAVLAHHRGAMGTVVADVRAEHVLKATEGKGDSPHNTS